MSELIDPLVTGVYNFSYYYPLFMSYLWMIGALAYYFRWERYPSPTPERSPRLPDYPGVSVIVPCHNEAENLRETLDALIEQDYPALEIVLVNDASTDGTAALIDELARDHRSVRAVHLRSNQGKGMALRVGALVSRHELLVCIDGDALLARNAVTWLMYHLVRYPRVAAVTGNPRIRTRSTLLGKIQVGEFSSIIGLIKRAQRIYGRIFTVSGVVAAFRKSALQDAGYWSTYIVTDDIDVSWSLQLRHWDIRFEPNALCWILMPETLGGLWRQRLRWAQGGTEVLVKNLGRIGRWHVRRMWPVYLEYVISMSWAYAMAGIAALWVVNNLVVLPEPFVIETLMPAWTGVILGLTCMLQFGVSLAIDSRYERGFGRYYYWMIWYPMAFWVLNVLTAVVALPKALVRRRRARGVWRSPDRGLRRG
ncbi:MAG: poly-beta-1,6 N-acetyl-D-glucosamine synthase [Gammaproteobacteria bacterium]|nr:poly-beta-1,6 N-acetyl-D-glucosamine synthase [Gammaproteobacteria bacterium]